MDCYLLIITAGEVHSLTNSLLYLEAGHFSVLESRSKNLPSCFCFFVVFFVGED